LREKAGVWDAVLSLDGTLLASAGWKLSVKIRHAVPWWLDRGAPQFQEALRKLPR
jgi:hypothetical protein